MGCDVREKQAERETDMHMNVVYMDIDTYTYT